MCCRESSNTLHRWLVFCQAMSEDVSVSSCLLIVLDIDMSQPIPRYTPLRSLLSSTVAALQSLLSLSQSSPFAFHSSIHAGPYSFTTTHRMSTEITPLELTVASGFAVAISALTLIGAALVVVRNAVSLWRGRTRTRMGEARKLRKLLVIGLLTSDAVIA